MMTDSTGALISPDLPTFFSFYLGIVAAKTTEHK